MLAGQVSEAPAGKEQGQKGGCPGPARGQVSLILSLYSILILRTGRAPHEKRMASGGSASVSLF